MPIVTTTNGELNKFKTHSSYFKIKKSKNLVSKNVINDSINNNQFVKTHSDNIDFTSTEGCEFSNRTHQNTSTVHNYNVNNSNQAFKTTNFFFNRPNKFIKNCSTYNINNNNHHNTLGGSGQQIFNSFKKQSNPVKVSQPMNSNVFQNSNSNAINTVNYSNQSYRPMIGNFGQHSFSIEPWHFNQELKENINNRSISQMNNYNLNNLFNFHSEEAYILENVDKLILDQNGCRILQKKLNEKNSEFLHLLFEKIKHKIPDLINGQFGNYLIQKLAECCLYRDINLLEKILEIIKENLLNHSIDPYGSRVIQKILEMMNKEEIINLIMTKTSNFNILNNHNKIQDNINNSGTGIGIGSGSVHGVHQINNSSNSNKNITNINMNQMQLQVNTNLNNIPQNNSNINSSSNNNNINTQHNQHNNHFQFIHSLGFGRNNEMIVNSGSNQNHFLQGSCGGFIQNQSQNQKQQQQQHIQLNFNHQNTHKSNFSKDCTYMKNSSPSLIGLGIGLLGVNNTNNDKLTNTGNLNFNNSNNKINNNTNYLDTNNNNLNIQKNNSGGTNPIHNVTNTVINSNFNNSNQKITNQSQQSQQTQINNNFVNNLNTMNRINLSPNDTNKYNFVKSASKTLNCGVENKLNNFLNNGNNVMSPTNNNLKNQNQNSIPFFNLDGNTNQISNSNTYNLIQTQPSSQQNNTNNNLQICCNQVTTTSQTKGGGIVSNNSKEIKIIGSGNTNISNNKEKDNEQDSEVISSTTERNIFFSIVKIFTEFGKKNILNLVVDLNGNHVLQKIYILSRKNNIIELHNEIVKNIIEISKLKQGASLIQKIFDNSNENEKRELGKEVLDSIDKIVNDEYANFVLQMIVNLKLFDLNDEIYDYLCKNLYELSKKKYSSNVIDRCILNNDCNGKYRNRLIDSIIECKMFSEVLTDQFGNYVIQKALSVSEGIKFLAIIQMIKPCLKNLKYSHYSKRIYDNLMNQYGDYLNNGFKVRSTSFHKESNNSNANNKEIVGKEKEKDNEKKN